MSTPQNPYSQQAGPPSAPPPPAHWPGPMPPSEGGFGRPVWVTAARPGSVLGAVVCWLLAGVTLIVSGAFTTAAAATQGARDALRALFADSQLQLSDAAAERILIGTGLAGAVVGLLTIAFGLALLGAAGWVRVVLTVLGVLGVLLVVYPVLFVALAVVLQFLPASNAWFRSRVAARRAG